MRLGRIDEETTANIGTIAGGQATNIVARSVCLEGEARSHDPENWRGRPLTWSICLQEAARQTVRDIDGRRIEAEVHAEMVSEYPRMVVSPEAPIVQLVVAAGTRLGRQIEVRAAGGGSDANIFNSYGIETVILGTGMTHVHSVEESVSVEDMVRVAELLVEIIANA